MQDMLPGVLSTVLILLGPTLTNSSSLPIECRMTVNSSVLHSSSGSVECQYAVLILHNSPYCLEEQIRCLDSKTQYAVLSRKLDTSYPTGGYGVSGGFQPERLAQCNDLLISKRHIILKTYAGHHPKT
ncbi:hypothetical protein Tco_0079927 [Tanacetum coccineum]